MALFAFTHLLDKEDAYKHLTQRICRQRRDLLWRGLGLPAPHEDPLRAWYYVELDLEVWARKVYGDDLFEYLKANYEPVDFLFGSRRSRPSCSWTAAASAARRGRSASPSPTWPRRTTRTSASS
jgi:hypothetical protein